jgi:hypothetical protein
MFAHGAGWTETNMTFFSVQFRKSWIHHIYLTISMRRTGRHDRCYCIVQDCIFWLPPHRYCSDCPQCIECDVHKSLTEYEQKKSRHLHDRCRACQYPTCANSSCDGYRHPLTSKAILARNKIRTLWFCRRTEACRTAATIAKKDWLRHFHPFARGATRQWP